MAQPGNLVSAEGTWGAAASPLPGVRFCMETLITPVSFQIWTFVTVSKASVVLGERWLLLFDSLGLCSCSLPLCSERFRDVAANSSSLRCSFCPWLSAARPRSAPGSPGSHPVRSLQDQALVESPMVYSAYIKTSPEKQHVKISPGEIKQV